MREHSRIQRLLLAIALLLGLSVLVAPAASAGCIAGDDYIGVSPTGPVKVGDGAYTTGIPNAYTVPEWYGYGAPPLTNWYMENDKGVINTEGSLCSTTNDQAGIFNQGFPSLLNNISAGVLGIDFSLLDAATQANDTVAGVQSTVEGIINSPQYGNLYNVLLWVVIAVGIVTVALLVFTQDQRDRSDLMRTLMSGGSVQSRKSAGIKEIGWILGSIALFGAIVAGLPYAVQSMVSELSGEFSTAIQTELGNFSRTAEEASGAETATADNICAVSSSDRIGATYDPNSVVKCNMYRIYEWTPWLAMQFGGTDASVFTIDLESPAVTGSEELTKAVEQVRAKFGDSKANLAPYLQMQILQGNNNEFYNGAELTPSERHAAFKALGEAIDTGAASQAWAVDWAGQGANKWLRPWNAFVSLVFAVVVAMYVGIVASVQLLAIYAAAILPLFGLFFAVLLGMRQFRKKGMRILKWWLYAIIIPALTTLALALALSVSLIITGLIDFSGAGLIVYLFLSSVAFLGTLIYMIWLLRKSKKVVDTVDGSADDGPGLIKQGLAAGAAIGGSMIAPGVGGAIGGAIGAKMTGADASSGAEEPRPELGGAGDEEEPLALESGTGGGPTRPSAGAVAAATIASSSRSEEPPAPNTLDDDEIVDAEIVEEFDASGNPVVIQGRAISGSSEGWGGEEPRVGPQIDEPRAIGSQPYVGGDSAGSEEPRFESQADGVDAVQAATVDGVNKIVQTTNAAAIFLDDEVSSHAESISGSAEEAAQAFADAAGQAAGQHADSIGEMHSRYGEQLEAQATQGVSMVQSAEQQARTNLETHGETERAKVVQEGGVVNEKLAKSREEAESAAGGLTATQANLEKAAANANTAAEDLDWAAHDAQEASDNLEEASRLTDETNTEARRIRRTPRR